MNWLQFIAVVVDSVVWPITVIAAFLLLKSQLPVLFPFVERLKYRGLEVEFRKDVQQLSEQSRAALPALASGEQPDESRNRLYAIAEISLRAAILEAWLEVEAAAANTLQIKEPSLAPKVRMAAPLRLGEMLTRSEILNADQLRVFHSLRELRNKSVHITDDTLQQEALSRRLLKFSGGSGDDYATFSASVTSPSC